MYDVLKYPQAVCIAFGIKYYYVILYIHNCCL